MRLVVGALAFALIAAAQAPVNCRGKLSEEQLVRLIVGKVPEPRLLQYVNQCGIGFVWSEKVRARLSRAGATNAVLSAVESQAEKPARNSAGSAAKPVVPPARVPEKPAQKPAAQQERVRTNPKDGLTYGWIPAGSFTMGCSPADSECDADEKPVHQVTIANGFWMGQTPVTQAAYQRVTGQNPSHFLGPNLPVENVSWNDGQSYCGAVGMRLPSEAEWEYAARAGSTASRYGDIDQIAWHSGNSGSTTHEVGQKQPNVWGLYDMLGNVWQWTGDWYADYSADRQSDPRGPASGQFRVLRGGSWNLDPRSARVSYRLRYVPEVRLNLLGFRCVGN